MTYLKTALIASVAIAFSSVPAFAGENMHKDHMNAKTYTQSVTDAEAMKINDTIGEVLQADGDADPEADRKLLMSNGDQMTKAKLKMMDSDNIAANNAIVVPTIGSNVLTTVACPVGTTAQPDMTCHVTGNYNPTS